MDYEDLGNSDKMSSMRTSLSFQRTRMSADRTLMSIMRTSFSMIGFGFTLYSFFRSFATRENSLGLLPQEAPGRIGFAMVVFGTVLLIAGILNDYRYMHQLRAQRQNFIEQGLLPGTSWFPRSLVLIMAFALLLLGLVVIFSILLRAHPFS